MSDTRFTREHLRAMLQSPYTPEEEERLEALATPWPLRPVAYLFWLAEEMPERTGATLAIALVLAMIGLLGAVVVGAVFLIAYGGAWLFCLLGGIVLGVVGRAVLRDALETERRVRHSIEDKQGQTLGKGGR